MMRQAVLRIHALEGEVTSLAGQAAAGGAAAARAQADAAAARGRCAALQQRLDAAHAELLATPDKAAAAAAVAAANAGGSSRDLRCAITPLVKGLERVAMVGFYRLDIEKECTTCSEKCMWKLMCVSMNAYAPV